MSRGNAIASSSRHATNGLRASSHEEDSDSERRVKLNLNPDVEDASKGWTIDTYEPKSMAKNEIVQQSLKKVQNTMENLRRGLISRLANEVEYAQQIEQFMPDDEMLDELTERYCKTIITRQRLDIRIAILKVIIAQLGRNDLNGDPQSIFDRRTEEQIQDYENKTTRQKFKEEKAFIDLREAIWAIHHEDEACPPMSRWLPKEAGDDDDDDDSFEIGGMTMTQDYRCKIDLKPLREAVVNPACKHHFSKDSVMSLFEQSQTGHRKKVTQIRCPAAGCKQLIFKNQLQEDPDFQKKVDTYFRRQAQKVAEQEEDEDIVDISQE